MYSVGVHYRYCPVGLCIGMPQLYVCSTLLIYQFILNLNLTVNILLKAFKSFLGKYSIVCIFIQTNHFNTHAIFMSFISQSINFSNFLT